MLNRSHNRDEGFTLVFVALILVVLMVFTALVVDLGGLYNERRQDQNAADAGALAAAQSLSASDSVLIGDVKKYVHGTLERNLTNADWNSCNDDPGALAVKLSTANCISLTTSRSRVRVRIPDQDFETSFARVVGRDEFVHSAFAIAGFRREGFGGVLPFALASGSGSGDGLACVKDDSGGLAQPPCDGPDTGNFGTIDLGFYGDEDLGTLALRNTRGLNYACKSGGKDDRISNNLAVGTDHDLGTTGSPLTASDVTAGCESLVPHPNNTDTQPGLRSGPVGDGLVGSGPYTGGKFSDGGDARLKRKDSRFLDGNGQVRTVHGNVGLDDNPLWLLIRPELSVSDNVPASCLRNQFVDSTGSPSDTMLPPAIRTHLEKQYPADPVRGVAVRQIAKMQRCFAHYLGESWTDNGRYNLPDGEPPSGCGASGCDGAVFDLDTTPGQAPEVFDIQYTPRFAYVPEIEGSLDGGGTFNVRFKDFRAIYIQTLTFSGPEDGYRWDPGFPSEGSGDETTVRGVSTWVFPPGMLPNGLSDPGAPYAIGVNRFIALIR